MKVDVKRKLAEKICSEYCLSKENAIKKASYLYKKCPDRLKKNLYQWAVGEPLEDIFVDKYSVPMILTIWGNHDFIGAIEVVAEYLTGDRDIAERRIWQMRR